MEKKFYIINIILFISLSFVLPSCDKHEDSLYTVENNWIYTNMNDFYFWCNNIEDNNVPGSMYPEDYFYSLTYDQEDKWSYITDDYAGLMASLTGEPVTMGYSPTFGQFTGSNNVFMVIEYVYPNSPAAKAGLQRGDIVMEINDKQLNTNNYADLFHSNTQTLTLAENTSNGLQITDEKLYMNAELIQVNPVVFDTIFESNNTKIGYCVITEFIDDAAFIQHVGESLKRFKTSGIDELIVDFRYNGGGYMNSAQWLSSAIAPTSVINNKSILTNINYNNKLNAISSIVEREIRFIENDVNLDLSNIYFLCARGTASASELVMIGLMPYMNVVSIGENTFGKYTGSWVIPDMETPPRHNWAMMPIVLKYSNANGYTEFKDGLSPNYFIKDEMMNALPFGNLNDPILAQAIQLCGGIVVKSNFIPKNTTFQFERFFSKQQKNKMNLFMQQRIN